tara:strand:- start:3 stop:245 length:243 start_codon:yes stop_codon:yes gene_type:complete
MQENENKEPMTQEVDPKMVEVSVKIKELLEDNGFAIQPILNYTLHGIIPEVKLVKVPNENGTDEGGVTKDTTESGAAESE